MEIDYIDRNIREEVQHRIHKLYLVQLKKLQKLLDRKSTFNTKNELTSVTFHSRVKNLSNITFNDKETKLMEKGLKYCPSFEHKKT